MGKKYDVFGIAVPSHFSEKNLQNIFKEIAFEKRMKIEDVRAEYKKGKIWIDPEKNSNSGSVMFDLTQCFENKKQSNMCKPKAIK